MNVLVIDVGGSHVKVLVSGQTEARRFGSGPTLTPRSMVLGVQRVARDWTYDAISIGYPGPVLHNVPVSEPHNLGRGWVGFNFEAAFGRPVKLINDAAMQAWGSYQGGKMLFLGLGTGLGSAMIVDGVIEPMELGRLPYKKYTYEHFVGQRGLDRWGIQRWQRHVADVVAYFIAALEPDDVVLGGGNVKKLEKLPLGCRAGDNANAFVGGFRLWENADQKQHSGRSRTLDTFAIKPKERNYGNSSRTPHKSSAHGATRLEGPRGPSRKGTRAASARSVRA